MSVRNSSAAKPAPLWVWGLTGSLLLLGSVFLLQDLWHLLRGVNQNFSQTATGLLQRELDAPATRATRVVVVGTSLTEYGLLPAAYFDQQTKGRYRVITVHRSAANLETFTDQTLVFQQLVKTPPDILCLEENLLFFDLGDDAALTLDKYLPKKIAAHFSELVEKAKDAVRGHQRPVQTGLIGIIPGDTLTYQGQAEQVLQERGVRAYAPANSVHHYLKLLRAKGTRLVILHFPRPTVLEQIIYSGPRLAQFQQLRRQYQQLDQMSYWHEPGRYPFASFLDFAHLNPKGQAVYSAWLAQRLLLEPPANHNSRAK